MKTIELGYNRLLRLSIKKDNRLILSGNTISVSYPMSENCRKMADITLIAELFIPRGARVIYGLLGLDYICDELDKLNVRLPHGSNAVEGELYNEALVSESDTVHVCLLNEYSEIIRSTIESLMGIFSNDIAGSINFHYAACAEVSSNGWVFSKLTEILINLLRDGVDKFDPDKAISILD